MSSSPPTALKLCRSHRANRRSLSECHKQPNGQPNSIATRVREITCCLVGMSSSGNVPRRKHQGATSFRMKVTS